MRYIYEIDLYDIAGFDAEAKIRAEKFCKIINDFGDHKAKVIKIIEMPFGSKEGREVEL